MVDKLQQTTIRPYAQVQGGVTNYMDSQKGSANAELGLRLNSGNLRTEAGAKAGTDLGAKAEVGYTVPFNKNLGLDLNAGGDYSRRLSGSGDVYKGWTGAGIKLAPNEKFNVTFGVEGGVRGKTANSSNEPTIIMSQGNSNIEVNVNVEQNMDLNEFLIQKLINKITNNGENTVHIDFNNSTMSQPVQINESKVITPAQHRAEPYISPKIAAEYNINPNMSVGAKASLNEAQVGLRWTF